MEYKDIPDDPVRDIFTFDVRARLELRLIAAKSEFIRITPDVVRVREKRERERRFRPSKEELAVLATHAKLEDEIFLLEVRIISPLLSGLCPDAVISPHGYKRFRAQRSVLETYLTTAFALGMFEGADGNDLRSRLVGKSPAQFWQAYAECFAAWILAAKWKLPVTPYIEVNGKRPEFCAMIDGRQHVIEVKAPYHIFPLKGRDIDEASKLHSVFNDARKQFPKDTCNTLFLVPRITYPRDSTGYVNRNTIIKAFVGEEKLQWSVNTNTWETGETEAVFVPNGLLAKHYRGQDGLFAPRNTRFGGVVLAQEKWQQPCDNDYSWVEPNVFGIKNPYAVVRQPELLTQNYPCFKEAEDGTVKWDDGKPNFQY